MSQSEAEAGTATTRRAWTAQRVKQAIDALAVTDVSVHVTKSGNQTLTTGVDTFITWDTETFDTDTMHSTVTNTSRLTATTAGKYCVGGHVEIGASATGQRDVLIMKNGTTVVSRMAIDAAAAGVTIVPIAGFVQLSATDYVELRVTQNSGGNLDVAGGGANSAFWAARMF